MGNLLSAKPFSLVHRVVAYAVSLGRWPFPGLNYAFQAVDGLGQRGQRLDIMLQLLSARPIARLSKDGLNRRAQGRR